MPLKTGRGAFIMTAARDDDGMTALPEKARATVAAR